MRQMSLSIKLFAGSEVSSAKKIDEKSRFGEVSTEIQEIVDNAVSVTTKKATSLGMRLFNSTYQLSFP